MVIGTVYFGLWSVSPYCGWTFTMLFWGSHCVFCSREDAPAAFLPSVPLRTPLRQGLPLSTASKYTCGSAAINGIFANRHSGSSAGSPFSGSFLSLMFLSLSLQDASFCHRWSFFPSSLLHAIFPSYLHLGLSHYTPKLRCPFLKNMEGKCSKRAGEYLHCMRLSFKRKA